MREVFTKIVAAAFGTILASSTAWAEFPERTIENIFPWGPGAAMASSQVVASALGEELGTTVTVISTPGAGGTKAFQTAMNRPADGYTIINGYVAPLVLQPVLGNADWTYEDFIPLHGTIAGAFSIGIRADDDRWGSFEEMMAYGKENPGELRYSGGIRNALPHMVIAKVLQEYGVVARNIPYNGPADALKDLQAGLLDFSFVNVTAAIQRSDEFKVLLVLSELDSAKESFGGAPSLADLGLDLGLNGLGPMGWAWWLVHKDTPQEEVEILQAAMARTMNRQDVQDQISNLGFVPLLYGPDQYEEIVGPVVDQLRSMGDALAWEAEQLEKLN